MAMTNAWPVEILEPGDCDKSLPANEVVEEYTFGQFVKLRYPTGGGRVRPVTGMLADDASRTLLSALGASSLYGAVSISALLRDRPEALPEAEHGTDPDHLPVKDVDDLIARRKLRVRGEEASVSLEEGDVVALLLSLP